MERLKLIRIITDSIKNNHLWLIGDGDRNMEAIGAKEVIKAIMGRDVQPTITRVLFNDPATIVWFSDGDKVVCVCDERDYFDKEKGVLHCIAKKFMGSTAIAEVSAEWEEEECLLEKMLPSSGYHELIYGKIPENNGIITNAKLKENDDER